jgi:predicted NBD/HSP70 family sugar kinase
VVLEKAREGLQAGRQSIVKELPADHLEQAVEAVIVAAAKGDQFMIELLSDAGYTIGRGAAVLIHLLNPEVIILSGRGASPGIIWQTPIQQALNEHCIPRLSANTSIEISSLGYKAEIIGAAALVMDNYHQPATKKIRQQEAYNGN